MIKGARVDVKAYNSYFNVPVRLDNYGVEILNAIVDVGRHGIAGTKWHCILNFSLNA